MEESWKEIKDFPDYFISNFGRIKSLKKKKETILNPRLIGPKEGNKYLDIEIYKNKKRNHYKIHRLVALHFIENPFNLPVVNHIDGNVLNNHENNLEWVTIQENVCHGAKKLNTSSNYTGVSFCKEQNKWKAQINVGGINKNLGRFKTEKEAYDRKLLYEKELGIINKYN